MILCTLEYKQRGRVNYNFSNIAMNIFNNCFDGKYLRA